MENSDTRFKDMTEQIDSLFPDEKSVPELKHVKDNMDFEKDVLEKPIPPGIGETKVLGYETWDINSILKGNYWRRSIYTNDKICKLFLKADWSQKKKYLRKRNPMQMKFLWFLALIALGVVVLIIIIVFVLPLLGGSVGGII